MDIFGNETPKGKTKLPSILRPSVNDFTNLKRYIVDNKSVRNALHEYGALKIIPPDNWGYKFNENIYETVFNGKNNLLSLFNVEAFDKLSFKRFYDLYLKAEGLSFSDAWGVDLSTCASEFGVDLYKLYRVRYGLSGKLSKEEAINQTCSTLGIASEKRDKVEQFIEKYLEGFQRFLLSDNKDLNSASALSRHIDLIKVLHSSSTPRSSLSLPVEYTLSFKSKWSNRSDKLRLMSQQYCKRSVQFTHGKASSDEQQDKKSLGLRKPGPGRIQKAKSLPNTSNEVVGVRSTRSMIRRFSSHEAGSNGNGVDNKNGERKVERDSPEMNSNGSETQLCRQCRTTDIPRSQLRHCSSCDLYFHAACCNPAPSATTKIPVGKERGVFKIPLTPLVKPETGTDLNKPSLKKSNVSGSATDSNKSSLKKSSVSISETEANKLKQSAMKQEISASETDSNNPSLKKSSVSDFDTEANKSVKQSAVTQESSSFETDSNKLSLKKSSVSDSGTDFNKSSKQSSVSNSGTEPNKSGKQSAVSTFGTSSNGTLKNQLTGTNSSSVEKQGVLPSGTDENKPLKQSVLGVDTDSNGDSVKPETGTDSNGASVKPDISGSSSSSTSTVSGATTDGNNIVKQVAGNGSSGAPVVKKPSGPGLHRASLKRTNSAGSQKKSSSSESSPQWQCPICFKINWIRGFAPTRTIPTSLDQESSSLLDHFWQVVQYGGTKHSDINVYHAEISTNWISGFASGCTPGIDPDCPIQGDLKIVQTSTITMDSIYSSLGFTQEQYQAPRAKKTWYIVRDSAQLGTLLKTKAPALFSNPAHTTELLTSVPLLIHPADLLSSEVPYEVIEQSEGEFVLFSPGLVKCYVAHGACISEQTLLPLPQWAPILSRYFHRTRHPANQLSHGYLLTTLTNSTLFTLPLKLASRLFACYTKFMEMQVKKRKERIASGATVEKADSTSLIFQDARCSVCHQKFYLTALERDSTLYCIQHVPRCTHEEKEEKTGIKIYISMSTVEMEKQVKSLTRRFKMYSQFAEAVTILQDIRKKPDASDLKDLLNTAREHKFLDNIYYEHLVSSEKCLHEFETKFLNADVNQLTIPQLLDLRLIVEATDFLLPGESRLYTLLRSDDEPRALLKLYNAGILSVSQLRRRVEVLPPANPVNRDTMEALANAIKVGLILEQIIQSVQRIHTCNEERIEELIDQSYRLAPTPQLESCVEVLKQVLDQRQEWKNKALDLLDKDEPKVPLEDWVAVVEEGKTIDDYVEIKTKLNEQITKAREFETVAKSIVIYDMMKEQPLTHDVEEIANLLQDADTHIQVKLETYELLSKEHKDAGIWLRLADLCFLWPKSEFEIISILMSKTFSSGVSPWFIPLVPSTRSQDINAVLSEILSRDKRDILRQEYQALMALRAYHQTTKQIEPPPGKYQSTKHNETPGCEAKYHPPGSEAKYTMKPSETPGLDDIGDRYHQIDTVEVEVGGKDEMGSGFEGRHRSETGGTEGIEDIHHMVGPNETYEESGPGKHKQTETGKTGPKYSSIKQFDSYGEPGKKQWETYLEPGKNQHETYLEPGKKQWETYLEPGKKQYDTFGEPGKKQYDTFGEPGKKQFEFPGKGGKYWKQNESAGWGVGVGGIKYRLPVCFCGRNVCCTLIFCYLCRNYYHEKCIMKALKRREVHNTESNISNLNYKVPPNLSALGDLDLFICVKCVWGKRPRLGDVKGRIVDVLSEVRLKLPEGIALIHCLQRTLLVQAEIKSYLNCKDVVKLKEISEYRDKLLHQAENYGTSPTSSYASSRGSDDYPPPIQLSNASSSRTAGDSLISKQRKHKRKSTLIPRIDNDALQSMAAANINAEEVKATGVELLNKGLLLEIHIPELSDLLTFIRHLDKDFGVYAKIKMPPPPKKERMKKSLPLSHYSSPGERPRQKASTSTPLPSISTVPFPSNLSHLPSYASSFPTDPAFPSNPANFPSNTQNFPEGSSNFSSNAQNFPPNASNFPPNDPSFPPNTSSFPTDPSNFPANASNFPTNAQNFPANPSDFPANSGNFVSNPANFPSNASFLSPPSFVSGPTYPIGLTAVAEAALMSAGLSPPSPTVNRKAVKAKTPGSTKGGGKVGAGKSPGGPKTPKAPTTKSGEARKSGGPNISSPAKPAKAGDPRKSVGSNTSSPAKPRQRKPRTAPSNSPGGSSVRGDSSSLTPQPATKKKKKNEKFEFCDLEDCLEPDGEIDWVQCDKCERWFHFICVGITNISKDDPYVCTYCCNSIMTSKMDTEANEDTAVTSLLCLSRGFI
ncbi:hypothetical protein M8J75_001200 [Diaphorina citri]|nr:hypothetical protein M8J75_001200 [Diaphorina citri]